jgi:TRAP-type C4-dicarboxylate transport system permease small subunit
MNMTTRKCLSIVSWGASLVFCGLLLFSAYAAAAHKTPATSTTTETLTTVQAQP